MKKILLIVTVLSLTAFAANAQKYVFYGNGAAKIGRTSYHNGINGVYVGYHPAGMSNSRVTGIIASKRSGYAISVPQQNGNQTGMRGSTLFKSDFSTPKMGDSKVNVNKFRNGNSRSFSSAAESTEGYNPMKSEKSNESGLGISSAISTFSISGSGSGSGSGSTGVVYGRTSSGSESSTTFGVTMSAMPKQMANTTNNNSSTDGDPADFFTELQGGTPNYQGDGPIGDAILPLLLLLIPVVVLKVRKH